MAVRFFFSIAYFYYSLLVETAKRQPAEDVFDNNSPTSIA